MFMAFMRAAVGVLRFEESDAPSQCDAGEQCDGKPNAVMRVERDFGQQIGQRNAKEDAGRKGERTADDQALLPGKSCKTVSRRDSGNRTEYAESDICRVN